MRIRGFLNYSGLKPWGLCCKLVYGCLPRAEEIAKKLEIIRVERVESSEGYMEVMQLSTELKITSTMRPIST